MSASTVATNLSLQSQRKALSWFANPFVAVAAIAFAKLCLHLYAGRHYGYFVDELYYLACSEHLDWGYVDQPPLIALITKLVRLTLGDSLPAIRFLPALAGAGLVLLSGALARELGGGRFAQVLASLSAFVAPGFLAMDSFLSMNAFEPLFWAGCTYVVVRIVKTGNERLWLLFGLLAGLGLENKHSMLIFGFGLAVGLLLTPERRLFRSPWIWLGAAIALLLFVPNLLWNIQHHFPFLELQQNIRRSGRNVALPPLTFLSQLTLTMLPLTLPVWLAGLWHYFSSERGRSFRALGWAWLITIGLIMALNPRVYYVYPAFPLVFASGGVAWEGWLMSARSRRTSLERMGWAYSALMVVVGAIFAPFATPVLPVESYIRYSELLHFAPPKLETHRLGPLPQLFADQFGWEEMVATVARFYSTLPPEIRGKTAIFGQNYGQAGAIDLFGPRYGLPKAISAHQNYFLWGPRDYTGESMIVLQGDPQELASLFDSVEKVAHVSDPYSMPYEHFDIFYCRNLHVPLPTLWPRLKNWD